MNGLNDEMMQYILQMMSRMADARNDAMKN
jgi:hypothetical protein